MVMIPALLTSTSTRSAAANTRATSSGSVMSAWTPGRRVPRRLSSTAGSRSARTSVAPSAAKRRRCPCRSLLRRRSRRPSGSSKRGMRGLLLVACARHGGVPSGDAGVARAAAHAARRTRAGGRALERLLGPDARAAPGEVRGAERGQVGARARGATARPLVSACSCISVRLAVAPPSASSVCTGRSRRRSRRRRPRPGRRSTPARRGRAGAAPVAKRQAGDQADRRVVPPRRAEAAEGRHEVHAVAASAAASSASAAGVRAEQVRQPAQRGAAGADVALDRVRRAGSSSQATVRHRPSPAPSPGRRGP